MFFTTIFIQCCLIWSIGNCQWEFLAGASSQCGQIIRTKRSVLEQPNQLPETCTYTIQAYSEQTCQLLIQFERFELQQPTLQQTDLACEDRFVVDEFTFCGENTGQHLYIRFPMLVSVGTARRQLQLNFHLPNRHSSTKWRLTLTQLECPHTMELLRLSQLPGFGFLQNLEDTTRNIFPPPIFGDLEHLAPAGCHQYYTQPSGTIRSFNFNDTSATLYMPNMKYTICIKAQMSAQKVDYNFRKFSMSIANADFPGYDEDCHALVATAGRPTDFLMIPQAELTNLPIVTPTYFCGRSLQSHQVSGKSPFIIYFESDDIADPIETGFSIDYMVKSA